MKDLVELNKSIVQTATELKELYPNIIKNYHNKKDSAKSLVDKDFISACNLELQDSLKNEVYKNKLAELLKDYVAYSMLAYSIVNDYRIGDFSSSIEKFLYYLDLRYTVLVDLLNSIDKSDTKALVNLMIEDFFGIVINNHKEI